MSFHRVVRVVCVVPLLLASPLCLADWLELKDGTSLRGIDYKPGKPGYFTLESGIVVSIDPARVASVKPSDKGETVDLRGQQVSLKEKVRTLLDERKARLAAAAKDLERWARDTAALKGGELSREAARSRDEFLAFPEDDREAALSAAVRSASLKHTRWLAARELAKHKGSRPQAALVNASIRDTAREVRETAFTSLKEVAAPKTGELFMPFLSSSSQEERVRAAGAMEAFPTRAAVPTLIYKLQKVWDGFGRDYFYRGEERAFIRDYNLVSGGTGFSIVEVADPEVDSVKTGVVLDVKVQKVEAISYARALRAITGEDYGADAKAWRNWWNAKGKKSGEAAAEPSRAHPGS